MYDCCPSLLEKVHVEPHSNETEQKKPCREHCLYDCCPSLVEKVHVEPHSNVTEQKKPCREFAPVRSS